MKKDIIKQALKALANAPQTTAKAFINGLKDESDKAEAIKLFKALNIYPDDKKQ